MAKFDARQSCRGYWLAAVVGLAGGPAVAAESLDELLALDLEALGRITVTSATRFAEPAELAPATVIVLRREELLQRGYRNLSEIYDHLPGMNVSRPYGDIYFKNYWRGLRRNVGSPYLVLIDGIELNDIHYNEDESLIAVPMSNIERVEVVYGPASAVYGANAFAGVINIITRQEMPEGESLNAQLRTGSNDSRIADITARYRQGDWRSSLSLRYDYGLLDDRNSERYAWTQQRYYGDRALWGGFLDNPNYGRFHSPHRHQAVDWRLQFRDTELVLQEWRTTSGYGSEYPADLAQNYAWVRKPQRSAYLRHRTQLTPDLDSATLLRWRDTLMEPETDFLEGYNVTDTNTGLTRRVLDYSQWDHRSSSWTLQQDLIWRVREDWLWAAGANLENKRLQKAQWINFGPALTPADVPDLASYPLPALPAHTGIANNRIDTRERGLYVATRYQLLHWQEANHFVHVGARYDDQSEYGDSVSVRAGLVSQRGPWVAKLLLLGQSYQEPPPRLLYGGWRGSGSDPSLRPERADTNEASLGYTQSDFSTLLSVYRVHSRDNIINFAGGAQNLGGQVVQGLDLHLNALWFHAPTLQLRAWGYYSYLDTDEARPQPDGSVVHSAIGDIARHSVRTGMTADLGSRWQSTLRGRYIGTRTTVPSNPVPKVPAVTVFDLNLNRQFGSGLSVALDAFNLFDRHYVSPGVRQADAGATPGFFDSNGVWQGSTGTFSSLLPQEGRTFLISVGLDF